jgi:hypothetical protein
LFSAKAFRLGQKSSWIGMLLGEFVIDGRCWDMENILESFPK